MPGDAHPSAKVFYIKYLYMRVSAIATNLTKREREVAKLSSFGFNSKEISSILFISESTVKQTMIRIMNKTGIDNKSDFVYII